MAEQIDSLLVSLGLSTDEQSFSDANAAFDQLQSKALQFGATIGAGLGLNELTFGFSEAVNEANKLAEEFQGLDVTPQFVSNLQTAFRLIDEDASEAQSTIRTLADIMEATDWGEISEQAFARGFNIDAIQNAETAQETLAELNRQMREMEDPERARRMASALGLGSAQFRLLRGTDVGEQMARGEELNPLTEAQSEAARQFQEGFAEVTASMDGLSRMLSEQFVGDLGESMSAIADILAENRDYIREFVETYGPYLADAAKGIGILVGLRAARAGLGILSKIPGSTLLAAGIGIGYDPEGVEESTDERNQSQIQGQIDRLNSQIQAAEEAGLDDRVESLREERQKWNQMLQERSPGGAMGRIPLVGPDQPLAGAGGGTTVNLTVDARQSTDPEQTRRATEQGVGAALARASENALLDIRTDVV